VIERSTDAILIVSNDGLVQYLNPAAMDLFKHRGGGQSQETFLDRRYQFFIAHGLCRLQPSPANPRQSDQYCG